MAVQKLTKTLVAKYEMSWLQEPHRVSEGSEKNFAHYSIWLQLHRPIVDEQYFEQLIAKAILFQTCDRIVGKLGLGGGYSECRDLHCRLVVVNNGLNN